MTMQIKVENQGTVACCPLVHSRGIKVESKDERKTKERKSNVGISRTLKINNDSVV